MGTSLLLGTLGLSLLALLLRSHRRLERAVTRPLPRRARASRYPSVTIVRPVRGRDPGADRNFLAALDTGYPGEVETLFVFDDDGDPGYPLAMAAVRAHAASGRPGRAAVIVAGPPPSGRTGKLNAMIAGERAAKGELIGFGDSDTRPDKHVLRVLVDRLLTTPGAGVTFAEVVIDQPLRTAGDVGHALMGNALYGASVADLVGDHGELPFIMGQLMVFRREALAAIGGVASADGQLVDDMYLGTRLAAAGFKNVLVRYPLSITTNGLGLLEFLRLYRRWLVFSRSGLPWSFTRPIWRRGLEFWAAALLLLAALALGHPGAGMIAGVAMVSHGLSLARLHRVFGGAPVPLHRLWAPAALIALGPAIGLAAVVWPDVSWRGRRYPLDPGARLSPPPFTVRPA